jgi:stage V sporulation protein R
VADANYLNRGELYLAHQFVGLEVDAAKATEVLASLRLLWGRPVHLQARINDDMFLLSMEQIGGKVKKERIGAETPPPAHLVV